MPKPPKKPTPRIPTMETLAFAQGLYAEFREQYSRYHSLTGELFSLQARLEVVEKNLCVTRDHLALALEKGEAGVPAEWSKALHHVRFVGMRLVDACLSLLRASKQMTQQEMLNALNLGTFRFRTTSPAREIHAALLRQQDVKRTGDGWVWTGPDEEVDPRAQPQPASLRLLTNNEPIASEKK